MSLLDKIKNFSPKKTVASAMLLGSLAFGYQGNAQKADDYQLRNIAQMETLALDHDNDGYKDIYEITKNPYENQIEFYIIDNIKGTMPRAPPTPIEDWSIPADKNRHFEVFPFDHDQDNYKDIMAATITNNTLNFYIIDNIKGTMPRAPPTPIEDWSIPIQKNSTFSIVLQSEKNYNLYEQKLTNAIKRLEEGNELTYKNIQQLKKTIKNEMFENMYVIIKNPYELKTKMYVIDNIKGIMPRAPPTPIDSWTVSLGSPKN